jgi:hypothetical protein
MSNFLSSSVFLFKNDPLRFLSNPSQVRAMNPVIRTNIPADSATQLKNQNSVCNIKQITLNLEQF